MPYYLDNQSLMSLTETELHGLHQTLTAELIALPAGGDSSRRTAQMLTRIVLALHQKRQRRFQLDHQPRL